MTVPERPAVEEGPAVKDVITAVRALSLAWGFVGRFDDSIEPDVRALLDTFWKYERAARPLAQEDDPRDEDDDVGRLVREVWIEWAREQPDVAEHPSWLVPWDELPERDKEVDRRIARAIERRRGVAAPLLRAEDVLDEQGLAMLDASIAEPAVQAGGGDEALFADIRFGIEREMAKEGRALNLYEISERVLKPLESQAQAGGGLRAALEREHDYWRREVEATRLRFGGGTTADIAAQAHLERIVRALVATPQGEKE